MEYKVSPKFPPITLDIRYITAIYISPTAMPFIMPLRFICCVESSLPINMLIPVIMIIIIGIVLSDRLVYVSNSESINSKIIVIPTAIAVPFSNLFTVPL